MKKLLFLLSVVAITGMSYAQTIDIRQNTYQKVSLSITPGTLSASEIVLPEGVFSVVSMREYVESYNPGAPQLPQLSRLLQIPVCDSVIATVTNSQYTEYDAAELGVNHPLFPAQVSVSKSDPNPPFSYNQEIYNTDAFYALPLVKVEKAGVRRNIAMANVYVSPVQYNPVTKRIRVYTQIDVEFTFANVDMAATNKLKKYASPMFSVSNGMILNEMEDTRAEISATPIKYLIIGNAMFSANEDLAEFVAWKRRLGYLVEVVYTGSNDVGSTNTSIKSFIQNKYDNATAEDPAPTYLLFLGDREQLPVFNTQVSGEHHITDLYYATLAGNDYIPDCYYGRLSATNNEQLSHQIEKILQYEQYTMPDPSYLGNAVLIAGTDENFGPLHANGQINYIHNYYMNNNNPRYTNVMVHLYNSSSQAALIREEVSNGSGWTNYTAHGSETGWADPLFTTSQVSQLKNADKYGIMIGNCCQSGDFSIGECFGEALLRAEKKGAMGYIGASNYSYWEEDFYWAVGVRGTVTANPVYMPLALGMYDKLFHTHNESSDSWVSTLGGIMTAGNMAVQSSTSDIKQYYWEIYHCFGDPSVRAYLGVPSEMNVTANPVILIDATSYHVVAEPYAYVALTHDGSLIATSFADENGDVTLTLPTSLDLGDYELVVLCQNFIPYFQTVQVIAVNGPYVIPTSVELAQNTRFSEGYTVNMNVSLSNVGISDAANVYATLTPMFSVEMLQDSLFVGALDEEASLTQENAFSFVMPACEDFVTLLFTLSVHWDDTVITREVKVLVKLPKVVVEEFYTEIGNVETNILWSGDNAAIHFKNRNKGHASVIVGSVDLTCNYSGVQVQTDAANISGLVSNASEEKEFYIQIADTVPNGALVPLYYHIYYDEIMHIDTLYIKVGGDVDNFETGNFSEHDWAMNDYPWVIVNIGAYSGNYCARSANNLPHNRTSSMTVTISLQDSDTLSYYRRVSSEESYDKFYLYVDGDEKDIASGELPWTKVKVNIPVGTHTVKFAYKKDGGVVSGRDCAWLDNVVFPSVNIIVVEDVIDPTDVGVEEHELARAKVFPNPTNQWVNIESEQPARRVALFDLNGRVVKNVNLCGENFCQLDMGDVPSGFYLLQITFDNQQTQNLKIIKR
jgi:hypothetical protein